MIFFVWFLISTNSIWFSMIYCRPTFFRFFQFLLNFSHYSLLTNFTYICIFLLRQNWSTISLFKLKSLSKLHLLICIRYTNSILLISFLFHFLFLFLSFCSSVFYKYFKKVFQNLFCFVLKWQMKTNLSKIHWKSYLILNSF